MISVPAIGARAAAAVAVVLVAAAVCAEAAGAADTPTFPPMPPAAPAAPAAPVQTTPAFPTLPSQFGQLSPQNPGMPPSAADTVTFNPPRTGGIGWSNFGGHPADAPRDLNSFLDSALGWLRTVALIAGVIGLLIIAGLLIVGIRYHSDTARRALDAIPVVIVGVVIAGSAGAILSVFVPR